VVPPRPLCPSGQSRRSTTLIPALRSCIDTRHLGRPPALIRPHRGPAFILTIGAEDDVDEDAATVYLYHCHLPHSLLVAFKQHASLFSSKTLPWHDMWLPDYQLILTDPHKSSSGVRSASAETVTLPTGMVQRSLKQAYISQIFIIALKSGA
jgi:hypothetical protein